MLGRPGEGARTHGFETACHTAKRTETANHPSPEMISGEQKTYVGFAEQRKYHKACRVPPAGHSTPPVRQR